MLDDFQPGFPALNNALIRNFANWTPEERAEYAERKRRAETILKSIRERREAERAKERRV